MREGTTWLARFLALRHDLAPTVRAKALLGVAQLGYLECDFPGAASAAMEAQAICRSLEDRSGMATALNIRGNLAALQGHDRMASEFYRESLRLRRQMGDMSSIAGSLFNLAVKAQTAGQPDQAAGYIAEGLLAARQGANPLLIGLLTCVSAAVAGDRGDDDRAQALAEEAFDRCRTSGYRIGMGVALTLLGAVESRRERHDRAQTRLREAMAVAWEVGEMGVLAMAWRGLAEATIATCPGRAARLFAAEEAFRAPRGFAIYENERRAYERAREATRFALTSDALAEAIADGKTMTLEQAVEYALGDDPTAGSAAAVPSEGGPSHHPKPPG